MARLFNEFRWMVFGLTLCTSTLLIFSEVRSVSGQFSKLKPPIIDERSHFLGAQKMVKNGDWLYTDDGYHSVGTQVLASWIMRRSGEVGFKPSFTRINFYLWLATLCLVGCTSHLVFRSLPGAALATAIVASSRLYSSYISLVQYEAIAAFLCTLVTFLFLLLFRFERQLAKAPRRRHAILVAAGALVGVLIIFRVHFGLFVPFFLLVLAISRRTQFKGEALRFLGAFLLLCAPMQVLYSLRRGKIFIFAQNVTSLTFLHGLSENSKGFNAVRLTKKELGVHGLAFVFQQPSNYLKLLWRRAQVFTGVQPDVWFTESIWTTRFVQFAKVDYEFARRFVALFFFGTIFCFSVSARGPSALVLLFPLLLILLPQLIVDSSTRFLVPAIPSVAVIFAGFWVERLEALTLKMPKGWARARARA